MMIRRLPKKQDIGEKGLNTNPRKEKTIFAVFFLKYLPSPESVPQISPYRLRHQLRSIPISAHLHIDLNRHPQSLVNMLHHSLDQFLRTVKLLNRYLKD